MTVRRQTRLRVRRRPRRRGQVAGVSVTEGVGQLTVSWNAVTGASGYKVQWKSGSEDYNDKQQTAHGHRRQHHQPRDYGPCRRNAAHRDSDGDQDQRG